MRKLAVVLLLGAVACTPARRETVDRSILLSTRPAPTERTCEVVDTPLVLPAADALVDSARLAEDVRALWRGQELAPGYALLSMTWDEHGFNARREIIEHDLPSAITDSLQELVFTHRRTAEEGDPWGARLRIGVADEVSFRVGRQEYCPPKLIRGGQVGGAGRRSAWIDPLRRTKPRRVTAQIRVDESGVPVHVRLLGGTLNSRYERYVRELFYATRFEPALSDGIPVEATMRLPLTVRVPY